MNRFLFLVALSLTVNISAAFSQGDFAEGLKAFEDQQFIKAKSVFSGLSAADPADCKALYYLGQTYLVQKKYDSAEVYFKQIPAINPKSPYAFLANAIISLRANNIEGTIGFLKQAKKLAKTDPDIFALIVEVALNNAKPDTSLAKSLLADFAKVYPLAPAYYLVKAKYDLIKGDLGSAANDFEWAYYYDSENSVAYRRLGKLYSEALLYREAVTALNKSIEIDPDQVMVYKYLGDLQYRFGKYPEAKKSYQKYLAVAETNIDNMEKYAVILFYNKEFKAAAEEMQDVMLLDPSNPVMNRITAYVAYETGDFEGGMKYINILLKLLPADKLIAPDYLYYGKLLLKTGNDSAGIANIRKALVLDETKTEAYADLASALSKNKKHDDAIALYEKLVNKGFDKASNYFRIGKEYYYKGSEHKQLYDSTFVLVREGHGDSTSVVNDSIIAMECYAKADSIFTLVAQITPDFYGSYLWRGRVLSLIDSNMEKGLAKEPYEKVLSMLEKDNLPQSKSSIIECYKYLGAYNYLESERLALTDKSASATFKTSAIDFYRKIIALDPADTKSVEILDQLVNPPKPVKSGKSAK
jgi:tetratricopeptide (TPR) repeat protein